MRKIETRETIWFDQKPDCYAGKNCDEVEARWWCYASGDKDGDFQRDPLSLDPRMYPPGTKIVVREPVCPKCDETREPAYKRGKVLPGFAPKCRCGFDWDRWVINEFS